MFSEETNIVVLPLLDSAFFDLMMPVRLYYYLLCWKELDQVIHDMAVTHHRLICNQINNTE